MMRNPSRLLIVEDDPAIARVLERSLSKSGFEARIARNGSEAIAALNDGQFDFILCDYQLPEATGEDLCRTIRSMAAHADVPIALCTAKAHEVDVAGLIVELGLTRVFFKPFSIREITAAICKAVESAPASVAD